MQLFVEEVGSESLARAVDRADASYTVRLSYAEARAAFARQRRERGLPPGELRRVVVALDEAWPNYGIVEISEALVRRAGALAERHALRAYDAVHLAAAIELKRGGVSPEFACFDATLLRAARRERLTTAL